MIELQVSKCRTVFENGFRDIDGEPYCVLIGENGVLTYYFAISEVLTSCNTALWLHTNISFFGSTENEGHGSTSKNLKLVCQVVATVESFGIRLDQCQKG